MQGKKKPKFEIDPDGFRALQEGREPWQLAREPVANAFDEDGVTRVEVTIVPVGKGAAELSVWDNGPGFANLKDAWTLYADTYKRRAATTRGRFNRGEKELLAVALEGEIRTTCGTVRFDRRSRTEHPRTKTERGTIVRVTMPWTKDDVAEVYERLRRFVAPEHIRYRLNGSDVPRVHRDYSAGPVPLETVLDKGDGVLRHVTRDTYLTIYRVVSRRSVLMEMGIPVMSLTDLGVPFIIDVQQKVPMAPERDSVKQGYLRDVLAEVLNVTCHDLTTYDASASWVSLALKDDRAKPATVREVKKARVGDALILSAANPLAAERAIAAGYDVVSTRGWDPEVVDRFRTEAGWQSTAQVFPDPKPAEGRDVALTPGMERFRDFVVALAEATFHRDVEVRFVDLPGAWAGMECNTLGGIVVYVNKFAQGWFDDTDVEEKIRWALHEVAHLGPRGPHEGSPYALHDETWGENVARVGAVLAMRPGMLDMLRCGGSR